MTSPKSDVTKAFRPVIEALIEEVEGELIDFLVGRDVVFIIVHMKLPNGNPNRIKKIATKVKALRRQKLGFPTLSDHAYFVIHRSESGRYSNFA